MRIQIVLLMSVVSAASALLTSNAHAALIQTLTFSGSLGYGYDGSGQFGPKNVSLDKDAYSITFSYDASTLTNCSPGLGCYFGFSAASKPTEVVTINGVTQTFIGTSGGISFTGGSADDININVQGAGGLSFSGDFKTAGTFFPNNNNVSSPILGSFTNLALTAGTWNSSMANTSFGSNPTRLTANSVTAVPEPASLLLLGGAALGWSQMRRRKGAPRSGS